MASCAVHPEFPATSRCTRCGKAICAACERSLDGEPYCAECETELQRKLAAVRATTAGGEPTPAPDDGPRPLPPAPPAATPPVAPLNPVAPIAPPGLLRPLAFALAAGLVGAFAWYLTVRFTNYKLGLVAVGVGWLVGRGALFGARGRGSTEIAIGSVVVALGAMLFGEYLILDHLAREALASDASQFPGGEVPAFLSPPMFVALYRETVGVMDALFYALGAYEAWKLPATARRSPRQSPERSPLQS